MGPQHKLTLTHHENTENYYKIKMGQVGVGKKDALVKQ